jgi:hypothetical protein
MEQLKEYATQYNDGLITADEFLARCVCHLSDHWQRDDDDLAAEIAKAFSSMEV